MKSRYCDTVNEHFSQFKKQAGGPKQSVYIISYHQVRTERQLVHHNIGEHWLHEKKPFQITNSNNSVSEAFHQLRPIRNGITKDVSALCSNSVIMIYLESPNLIHKRFVRVHWVTVPIIRTWNFLTDIPSHLPPGISQL